MFCCAGLGVIKRMARQEPVAGPRSPRLCQRRTNVAKNAVNGCGHVLHSTDCGERNESDQKRIFDQILAAFAGSHVLELYEEQKKCVTKSVSQLPTPHMLRCASASRSKTNAVLG